MLLDFRYNFIKSLILADSHHLIKYTLFGGDEIRHIPRNILWPGEKFLKDDDLDLDRFNSKDNKLEDNEEIKPGNNMELAIYHCKGKFNLLVFRLTTRRRN